MAPASNEAIKQAVVAGLGISFIPAHTLGLERAAGRLQILDVHGTPVMRRWHIVRHKSKQLSPALGAISQAKPVCTGSCTGWRGGRWAGNTTRATQPPASPSAALRTFGRRLAAAL
jgi:hypothetical protein